LAPMLACRFALLGVRSAPFRFFTMGTTRDDRAHPTCLPVAGAGRHHSGALWRLLPAAIPAAYLTYYYRL